MADSFTRKPAPPVVESVFLGAIAAGIMAAGTEFWLFCQMAGPVPFFIFWLAVVVPFLAVTLFVTRRNRSVGKAVACGLGFSAPIAFVCFRLPDWYDRQHLGPFLAEIGRFIWLTPLACAAAMAFVTGLRQDANIKNPPPESKG